MNDNGGMSEPESPPQQPVSPQRRLQELRAIPERDRTDAQWDELNEIEIMLASANRAGAPDPNVRRNDRQGGGQNQQRRGGGPQGGRPGGNPGGHRPPHRGRQRQR
jgi:hypothetical protein